MCALYKDLDVYQRAFRAMIGLFALPKHGHFCNPKELKQQTDLRDSYGKRSESIEGLVDEYPEEILPPDRSLLGFYRLHMLDEFTASIVENSEPLPGKSEEAEEFKNSFVPLKDPTDFD